jgi:hypothetical protein
MGHADRMRIEADGVPASRLGLFLTRAEAAELRDALDDLLVHFDGRGMRTSRRSTT